MTSGNATIRYYSDGNLIGTQTFYCCGASDHSSSFSCHYPDEHLYCPQCGKVWGMVLYEKHFDYQPHPNMKAKHWTARGCLCSDCGGGSFFTSNFPDGELYLESLSTEMLFHELQVLLNQYKETAA